MKRLLLIILLIGAVSSSAFSQVIFLKGQSNSLTQMPTAHQALDQQTEALENLYEKGVNHCGLENFNPKSIQLELQEKTSICHFCDEPRMKKFFFEASTPVSCK